MRWYIVIFVSVDYYTYWECLEIVRSSSKDRAIEIAKERNTSAMHPNTSWQVETVINCGTTKPKEV